MTQSGKTTPSLTSVVHDLKEVTAEKKELKEREDNLRSALFAFGVLDYNGREHLLPTTTITVPQEFFERTGLTEDEFLDRSFPTWDKIKSEYDAPSNTTVYVLRKNPLYMPFGYEDDDLKVSKTVTEPTPEIDLETLKAEKPELFEKITSSRVVVELDGEKLQEALEDDDEIPSVLMRHTNYTRASQQRVGFKDA